jgi:lysophospholipase L1-like esterase
MKPSLSPGYARRAVVLAGVALAAMLAAPRPSPAAKAPPDEHWTATWGAASGDAPQAASAQAFAGQTLRLVVHTSIGGNRVRIRLSNETGSRPLVIGAAHIAVRANGADIMPGTDRTLTFNGRASIAIAQGRSLLSDPVELNVAALSDLAVSLYLPGTVGLTTAHVAAGQTSYVSLPGDFTGAAGLPTQRTILSWPLLARVDVDGAGAAIVAVGGSITEGARSEPDANHRWPDWLARRLQDARDPDLRLGVVNLALAGSRLLADPLPNRQSTSAAMERFDRDVLATSGVRYMVVLLGIDDIANGPDERPAAARELIAAYGQLIARAHEKGIAIIGATLPPFEGARPWSPARDLVRAQLNTWIRSSDEFDGLVDFDAALRDPMHLARLLPAYDSGDHLHPNDIGYQAMANAVPLELFKQPGAVARR